MAHSSNQVQKFVFYLLLQLPSANRKTVFFSFLLAEEKGRKVKYLIPTPLSAPAATIFKNQLLL